MASSVAAASTSKKNAAQQGKKRKLSCKSQDVPFPEPQLDLNSLSLKLSRKISEKCPCPDEECQRRRENQSPANESSSLLHYTNCRGYPKLWQRRFVDDSCSLPFHSTSPTSFIWLRVRSQDDSFLYAKLYRCFQELDPQPQACGAEIKSKYVAKHRLIVTVTTQRHRKILENSNVIDHRAQAEQVKTDLSIILKAATSSSSSTSVSPIPLPSSWAVPVYTFAQLANPDHCSNPYERVELELPNPKLGPKRNSPNDQWYKLSYWRQMVMNRPNHEFCINLKSFRRVSKPNHVGCPCLQLPRVGLRARRGQMDEDSNSSSDEDSNSSSDEDSEDQDDNRSDCKGDTRDESGTEFSKNVDILRNELHQWDKEELSDRKLKDSIANQGNPAGNKPSPNSDRAKREARRDAKLAFKEYFLRRIDDQYSGTMRCRRNPREQSAGCPIPFDLLEVNHLQPDNKRFNWGEISNESEPSIMLELLDNFNPKAKRRKWEYDLMCAEHHRIYEKKKQDGRNPNQPKKNATRKRLEAFVNKWKTRQWQRLQEIGHGCALGADRCLWMERSNSNCLLKLQPGNAYLFDCDHEIPKEKRGDISEFVRQNKKVDEIFAELAKCRLLHASCHKKHTRVQREAASAKATSSASSTTLSPGMGELSLELLFPTASPNRRLDLLERLKAFTEALENQNDLSTFIKKIKRRTRRSIKRRYKRKRRIALQSTPEQTTLTNRSVDQQPINSVSSLEVSRVFNIDTDSGSDPWGWLREMDAKSKVAMHQNDMQKELHDSQATVLNATPNRSLMQLFEKGDNIAEHDARYFQKYVELWRSYHPNGLVGLVACWVKRCLTMKLILGIPPRMPRLSIILETALCVLGRRKRAQPLLEMQITSAAIILEPLQTMLRKCPNIHLNQTFQATLEKLLRISRRLLGSGDYSKNFRFKRKCDSLHSMLTFFHNWIMERRNQKPLHDMSVSLESPTKKQRFEYSS